MASFDEYASAYDSWFLKNRNVLNSEVKLVAYFLKNCGRTLSVGCGSGLFEMLLKKDFDIHVGYGIEPAAGMAGIAQKRGLSVNIGTAEDTDFGENEWDTLLFNGTTSYINDLEKAFRKAYHALKPGGKIVVLDVPKESSYGTIYNLAMTLGNWDHPLLAGVQPPDPYPIEFVKEARWRTTAEKTGLLKKTGFAKLEFAQTLTHHPVYSNGVDEDPMPGYTQGDYVAICAKKEKRNDD